MRDYQNLWKYVIIIKLNIETNICLFIFLCLEQVSNVHLGVRTTIHALRFDGKKLPMAFSAA